MSLFNFNTLICGIGGLAGLFIALKWSDSRELALTAAIGSAMLIDLIMRLTNDEVTDQMLNPEAGGFIRIPVGGPLKFIPVWVICISLLILVGLVYFQII
ncbi:hypothetical protein [Gimesia maris]|uniref:hypothetical protein n=1 Tax=Gimesia maris TaxID=122 RepID=UPI00118919A4|nr:hypothetical protein [Gimesia maris]QDT80254.1 hypothetical protein Mal35_37250 [Gimesia maris]QDU15897.1 hypothetical protein CA11_37250 [Gimesia maris]|tara:strand:- start:426 stop:725 length:300 start_codon:yes stop_codon:yes gene_type:complete